MNIAGSTNGRSSLSESEDFGPNPSPATIRFTLLDYSKKGRITNMERSIIFTNPDIKYKDIYISGILELQKEGRHLEDNIIELQNNFEKYLEDVEKESQGIDLKEGRVPQTIFWMIVDGVYVGRVSIRHYLNEYLSKEGGHIGYDVVPSDRKKGYGTELLKYGLVKSKEMKLEKVLVTCDENNIASRKIIEKCGGVLENVIKKDNLPSKCRFWINLIV